MLLDGSLPADLRREVSDDLEPLLSDPEVLRSVEAVLYPARAQTRFRHGLLINAVPQKTELWLFEQETAILVAALGSLAFRLAQRQATAALA